ncbi:alanyl-tRNA editing protein [Rhodovibrio salinarum]|uniref:Alanine--tRNA ligase n=1 Tax=Rhodovibrio salinarum TaxID=1087 RepID=A0A934QLE7_9PROT|nr:alanyl-tRNA editing protein [Rhodovibrio salinarum]MBK1698694.1 Ala-tRNA(Pro) hydrolase [Rhodovibrio salinarum]
MQLLFRQDAYAHSCTAEVVSADAEAGILLTRSVFYPMGGGQPGDSGRLLWSGGEIQIRDTRKTEDGQGCLLIPAEDAALPQPGDTVTAELDWDRRHRLMRMHTTLHLLCSLVDGPVTGGQIGAEKSRLDFALQGESVDKEALERDLNALIEGAHAVTADWISSAELEANPQLVRTMSVKPPVDGGWVRTVRIGEVDYQPCGGTHVANTREIGAVRVGKVESKGKQNRRINVHLVD